MARLPCSAMRALKRSILMSSIDLMREIEWRRRFSRRTVMIFMGSAGYHSIRFGIM